MYESLTIALVLRDNGRFTFHFLEDRSDKVWYLDGFLTKKVWWNRWPPIYAFQNWNTLLIQNQTIPRISCREALESSKPSPLGMKSKIDSGSCSEKVTGAAITANPLYLKIIRARNMWFAFVTNSIRWTPYCRRMLAENSAFSSVVWEFPSIHWMCAFSLVIFFAMAIASSPEIRRGKPVSRWSFAACHSRSVPPPITTIAWAVGSTGNVRGVAYDSSASINSNDPALLLKVMNRDNPINIARIMVSHEFRNFFIRKILEPALALCWRFFHALLHLEVTRKLRVSKWKAIACAKWWMK